MPRIVPATVNGRPIALTADGDGLLRLWDLRGRTFCAGPSGSRL
ncbi:hypothetical protein ACFWYW_44855 [Nonomuraea sp. NPDC059023]